MSFVRMLFPDEDAAGGDEDASGDDLRNLKYLNMSAGRALFAIKGLNLHCSKGILSASGTK
ncbi:MAG: hypothetical protein J6J93_01345 [Muribaculaceae bacterium]|nr:hypothetical protein [Muribaculaceae bacterium]